MLDNWYSMIELPLSWEQFHQLPQNPAYKYEYSQGTAWLSPRPKTYHALLNLSEFVAPIHMGRDDPVEVRPLADNDWQHLPSLFSAAFQRMQPFASLTDEKRLEAARECVTHTRDGTEGPLISAACFTAIRSADQKIVGAILLTLLPPGDAGDWDAFRWRAPPPPDAVALRLGRPHLTWIFVSPWHVREAVGTTLLAQSVQALLQLGYSELLSTFLLGNDSSMLWHWRLGFRLLPYPGSMRVIQERIQREREQGSAGCSPGP